MDSDERRRMQGTFVSSSDNSRPPAATEERQYPNTSDYYNDGGGDDSDDLPTSFDVREAWPNCSAFTGFIADQSLCGSCWAVASAAVVTDRNCIAAARAGRVLKASELSNWVSAEDILTCAPKIMGELRVGSCEGGWRELAFAYVLSSGAMTGSPAYIKTPDPQAGCKPYPFPPAANTTEYYNAPKCTKSNCTNADNSDTTHIRISSYSVMQSNTSSLEKAMKAELHANGSIAALLYVYEDFFHYASGVYTNTTSDFAGLHAVRIIGWGVATGADGGRNTPYWLVANSWGSDWGEAGFFRIRRGDNQCNIESNIIYGVAR